MDEHFLFLASDDQEGITERNAYNDFNIILPAPLLLANRNSSGEVLHWRVALTDLYLEHPDYSFLDNCHVAVLCDIVGDSYIANTYSPVLRMFPRGDLAVGSLAVPYYLTVHHSRIESIRISLLALRGATLPTHVRGKSLLGCSLHFLGSPI